MRRFGTGIDLTKQQLQNAAIHNLSGAPASPAVGQVYHDITNHHLYHWTGTVWEDLSAAGVVAHSALTGLTTGDDHTQYVHVSIPRTVTAVHTLNPAVAGAPWTLGVNAQNQLVVGLNADKLDGLDSSQFAPVSHTHTASQVTDFSTVVNARSLSVFGVPTANLDIGNRRLINVAAPVNPNDAATMQYVQDRVNGLDWKQSVRYGTRGNIALTGLGTQANGSWPGGLTDGDRILVRQQSTSSQNGIYVAHSTAWTRAEDFDDDTATPGASVFVEAGDGPDLAGTTWTVTNPSIVVGTTAITFVQTGGTLSYSFLNVGTTGVGPVSSYAGGVVNFLNIAADVDGRITVALDGPTGTIRVGAPGVPRMVAASIGNGVATSFTVIHNFASKDVTVEVYDNSTPWATVEADVERTDINFVTIRFTPAPATNGLRVVVHG